MVSSIKKIMICCALVISSFCYAGAITPHKYSDELPEYIIPENARYSVNRESSDAPDIVYYYSQPDKKSFPIAILCGGSSDESNIASIIHFHRYFLRECSDLGLAVMTLEQWGVDGNEIDKNEWIAHYTRSQRFQDHKRVIDHLLLNPPEGWNGKLVFIGVSEGGLIVTELSADYSDHTVATVNWSGAGNWSWREELWVFLQKLIQDNPECPHDVKLSDCQTCLQLVSIRENYDALMDFIIEHPSPSECFLNMTYLYHADALRFPSFDYGNLKAPYLVVSGALDTIIESTDEFVNKAQDAGVPISYHRIPDMDHYVRKRPDVIESSFKWLEKRLAEVLNES